MKDSRVTLTNSLCMSTIAGKQSLSLYSDAEWKCMNSGIVTENEENIASERTIQERN